MILKRQVGRMRKCKAAFILVLILCLIPRCAALAKTGKVTASSINIRKSADSASGTAASRCRSPGELRVLMMPVTRRLLPEAAMEACEIILVRIHNTAPL